MRSRRAFLQCLAHVPWVATAAPAAARAADATLEAECFQRMGRLYEALRRWQRAHGGDHDWPVDLSVLHWNGWVGDLSAWCCPVVERTGSFNFVPGKPNVISHPAANPHSNYQYELSDKLEPDQHLGELPEMTVRDAKLALMRTNLRGWIPILRCGAHAGGYLNISADGRRYRSSLYWEERFNEIRPEPYTMPWMVAHHPGPPGASARPRSASLSPYHIDLGPVANADPDLPWIDGVPQGASLRNFIESTQAGALLAPIAFDARHLIQTTGAILDLDGYLSGRAFSTLAYPRQSRVLPLNGVRARKIHLLHAAAFNSRPQSRAGEVVLISRGGGEMVIPLEFAVSTERWRSLEIRSDLVPAWSGTAYHSPLLYRSALRNPEGLADAVRAAASPGIVALREHCEEGVLSELKGWDNARKLPRPLKDQLLNSLNRACAAMLQSRGESRPAETFRAVLARLAPGTVDPGPLSVGSARLFVLSVDLPPEIRQRGLESLQLRANSKDTASPFLAGVTLEPIV